MSNGQNVSVKCSVYGASEAELPGTYWDLFNSSLKLCRYYEHYAGFIDTYNRITRVILICLTALSASGLLGALLILITLQRNVATLSSVSYLYFRVLASLEILNNSGTLIYALSSLLSDSLNGYYTAKMQLVTAGLCSTFAMAISFLSVYMSVERSVACIWPLLFASINRQSIAVAVIAVCSVASLVLQLPSFFDTDVLNVGGEYVRAPSAFSETSFYQFYTLLMQIVQIVTTVAVLISTATAIGGLIKVTRMKVALNSRANGGRDDKTASMIRNNMQLCYLQLCQAVPDALDHVLSLISLINGSSFIIGLQAVKAAGLGYQDAKKQLSIATFAIYVIMFENFTYELTHSFLFPLYFTFSTKFRQTFIGFFTRSGALTNFPKSVKVQSATE